MRKIPVGILGATGMVGQHYVQRLSDHPWFEIQFLAATEASSGKTYKDAVAGRWHSAQAIPEAIAEKKVEVLDAIAKARDSCRLVFSAMSNEGAKIYEELYAGHGLPVVSNASHHRMSPDVPVLIPEVNPSHCAIIQSQKSARNWQNGFIAVKPNCSLQSFIIPLTPLHERFKVKKLVVTTLQAMSGAGYPGVASLDIMDNVIPYINGEEEKSEQESLKVWGAIKGESILLAEDIAISVHCNRVPVIDGHLACISVEFEKKPTLQEILNLWRDFRGCEEIFDLPSALPEPIIYRPEKDRPQPRLDRETGQGMAVTVGRLRECPLLHYRFAALSHNTKRGAAGGGVLIAELLLKKGFIESL